MQILPGILFGCAVGSLAAAPAFYDGFACPGTYTDGQNLPGPAVPDVKPATTPLDGKPATLWTLVDKLESQADGAFVVRKAADVAKPEAAEEVIDPTDARKERARKRQEEKAKFKGLDREEKKKLQESGENIKKGAAVLARIKTTPGQVEMVAGQSSDQSILATLKKPISPPYYCSFLIIPDKAAGSPVTFFLEDVDGGNPVKLSLRNSELRQFTLNAGGLNCEQIEGPMFVVFGVEEDPKARDQWLVRLAVNPTEMSDPLARASLKSSTAVAGEAKDLARLRITKAGRVRGILDEVRIGGSIRDVMP